jgi:hypothetical protein
MALTVETGSTLEFDRFWRWLKRHPNCLVRVGTPDCYLYDQEDLHWRLDEEEDRTPVVQLMRAKQILGEVVLDVRDVLYVQVMPDPDGEAGQILYEVVAGGSGEPAPAYHFVMVHGPDDSASHGSALKQ